MSDLSTDQERGGGQEVPGGVFRSSRRRFLSVAGLTASALAVGVGGSACGTAQTGGGPTGRTGPSGDTFFVAGFQWGAPTSFNPLSASPAWPTGGGQSQLIYESLLRFNLIDGSLHPGLGTELQEDGKTFTVPLQEGTTWSDGQPLTAEDVVFTFEIARDNALSYSPIWEYVESVEAVDERTVVFTAKDDPFNPGHIRASIASTLILPQHVWQEYADDGSLLKETNLEPVGSGPFKLDKYDQQQVALVRHDGYWGTAVFGTPPMTAINHPIFKSNQDGDLKLASGEIDASQQFTSQIWKMWEDQGRPVGTWLKEAPYYLPGNIPLLIFNTTKKGLDNPEVRRAIAYSIDFPNIAATAMSSYSDTARASLVLPTGFEATFHDQAAVEAEGWSYDPEKTRSILEDDLGAEKDSDGIYVLPDGTKLGGWKVICPSGWTDWNTALEIVAKSAIAAGIGIETEFPQAPQVTQAQQNGDFDMVMNTYSGVSPASPWIRFRDALDRRGVPDIGEQAYRNFGRYENEEVAALLDAAGAATDEAEAAAAYAQLDAIVRADVPVVPLMYRPLEFYEFNSSTWTNFPTSENPYAPPMWQGAGIQWLFKLSKTTEA
ncbi:ABC transporter substrate-binding protein [Auraticoccus sp. F435]|uniref:ABC transporter substrate-binding protein n=1 Tax=Auraticoccus cholistanensis TaxID=2656650 RepID=A0A6A9UUU9_9ACTN|nr:ABC transporter substrate-binding protein [Auraticoccus cholistanensis]MVA76461.1 ABC transporter substrate-binding protein [Auraticoccus cholistanensis]